MADAASINFDFTPEQIEELAAYGTVERQAAGDVLVEEGTVNADLIITLSGHTNFLVQTNDGEKRAGWMERGQFAGDLSVLTGQASLARIVMGEDGEILRIAHDDMLRLMAASADYSDIFVRILSARRQFGHERGYSAVVLIGEAFDRATHALRDLLTKHDLPHRWYQPGDGPVPRQLLEENGVGADSLPVVILGGDGVLLSPSPEELATRLGLNLLPEGGLADMVVVGCGPAGLAAAVYGASEGLSVIAIDSLAPGGQAGTSSKIENYLGFPTGISGRDLAQRAALQAQKFGARLVAPVKATELVPVDGVYEIAFEDGRSLRARSVVIATGAQYQRLDIPGLEEFEARGVYYGATPMEANLCGGAEVAVVGAGNSAGQGALHLAGIARRVHVVYRREDIRETMSEYLVKRLEEHPAVVLHPSTEVAALHGDAYGRLGQASFLDRASGETVRCDCGFLFMFIGAAPHTRWLPRNMVCDSKGFVKTGTDITPQELVRAGWSADRMPSRYETSWPRVYAVGDVRQGSVKRVASGVGEGSVVVSDIHRALAEDAGN